MYFGVMCPLLLINFASEVNENIPEPRYKWSAERYWLYWAWYILLKLLVYLFYDFYHSSRKSVTFKYFPSPLKSALNLSRSRFHTAELPLSSSSSSSLQTLLSQSRGAHSVSAKPCRNRGRKLGASGFLNLRQVPLTIIHFLGPWKLLTLILPRSSFNYGWFEIFAFLISKLFLIPTSNCIYFKSDLFILVNIFQVIRAGLQAPIHYVGWRHSIMVYRLFSKVRH